MDNVEFYHRLMEDPPQDGEPATAYYKRMSKKYDLTWKMIKKKVALAGKKLKIPHALRGAKGIAYYAEKGKPGAPQNKANLHWSELLGVMRHHQRIKSKASKTTYQSTAKIDTDSPICLAFLSDIHIGSGATDYELFQQITQDILEIPNFYVILGGDEIDLAIKLRSVAEVHGNILDPELQIEFLRSWFNDIKHKVVAACAGNHDAWRTERLAGINVFKDIFTPAVPYSKGIFRLDLKVGEQTYKMAMSHTFKGNSMYNPVHSLKRHAREEAPECEIFFAGHNHKPGIGQDWEQLKHRVYINSGSIQTNSGYAKRFHSLYTAPIFPCVVLWPDQHKMECLSSVSNWVEMAK